MNKTFLILKKIIRKILGCREHETILDCLSRRKSRLFRHFYKKKYGLKELNECLDKLKIEPGDTLVVHCAWREAYNFTGSPNDLIDLLLEKIGKSGTLIMPGYSADLRNFDYYNSPSAAGVLSEVFRTEYSTIRSDCSHFSMLAIGGKANYLLADHEKSKNGFDEYSPYYKLLGIDNSKVLLIGLGKKPRKFSLIHVAEYQKCKHIFNQNYNAEVINKEGKKVERNMVLWKKGYLKKRSIGKIYDNAKSLYEKVSNMTLVCVDINEAYKYICDELDKGTVFTVT